MSTRVDGPPRARAASSRSLGFRAGLGFLLLLAGWLWASPARAAGTLSLQADGGGPVVLGREGDRFSGSFVLTNTGDAPIQVLKLGFRAGPEGKVPPGLGVDTEGGPVGSLAPGASRRGLVRFRPGADLSEWRGHLVATPASGAPAYLGVVADGVGSRRLLPALLVAIPLALALAALGLRERALRAAASLAVGAAGALAALALALLDRSSTTSGGGDGLSLVWRARLAGSVELYLGLDALTAPALVGVLVAWAASLAVGTSDRAREPARLVARASVGAAGLVLACLSQDGALMALGLLVGVVGVAASLHEGPLVRPTRPSLGLALAALVGVALVWVALSTLASAGGPGLAGDGSPLARSFAASELSRHSWLVELGAAEVASPLGRLTGLDALKLAAVGLTLGFGVLLPLPGLDSFALGAARHGSLAGLTLALGALAPTASALLVRWVPAVAPEGLRWAAPTLLWVGTLAVAGGALRCLRARTLRELVAGAAAARGGLTWVGLGSMLPQGMQGAVAGAAVQAVATVAVLLVAAHLLDTTGTDELGRVRGLLTTAPRLAFALALALAALAGAPLTASFAPTLLVTLSAVPRAPGLAVVLALSVTLLGVALAYAAVALWRGPADSAWRASPELEPFGGTLPDVRAPYSRALLPLAFALLALGMSARPLLSLLDARVLDLHRRVDPPSTLQVS